jgi:serine phosphatase RsbU (regulator of sigma subunit)
MEAVAVLPLLARGRCLGCLAVGFVAVHDFVDEELASLVELAEQCALALDRALLYDGERRANETLEFLAEATRIMVSALDPQEVLRRLVRLAVPRLAPWCAVYVADQGQLQRVAIEIAGHRELVDELRLAEPVPIDSASPLASAYRAGAVQIVPDISADMVGRTYSGERLVKVLSLGWRSAMVVPVPVRGQTIGVMSLVFPKVGPPSAELQYAAGGLAARAGIALDTAERYRVQFDAAQQLAAALLPERLPHVETLDITARYVPATGSVCGDWYEAEVLSDGAILLGVGDAVGHGLEAASTMAALRHGARGLALVDRRPGELLGHLGRLLESTAVGRMATALYGRLDPVTGRGPWASAGHFSPLLVGAAGGSAFADLPRNPLLGAGWAEPYAEGDVVLGPGATLILFTDGVVERRRTPLDEGLARLAELTADGHEMKVDELADSIVAELCELPEDDCCLLVVRRL